MSKIELLRISINKAIEEEDFSFLENIIDSIPIDILYEDSESLGYFFESLKEYAQKNYEKAKYLASLSYLKGLTYAKSILNLIEIKIFFNELNNCLIDNSKLNEIYSLIIKNSDDLTVVTLIIIKLFNYFSKNYPSNQKSEDPKIRILNLINECIRINPKNQNIHLLKLSFIYDVLNFEVDWDYIDNLIDILSKENSVVMMDILKDHNIPENIKLKIESKLNK